MLLLKFHQWLGPKSTLTPYERANIIITETDVMFATSMCLNDALHELDTYVEEYNKHYSLALVFRLLDVNELKEFASKEILDNFGVKFIEDLLTDF